MDARSEMQSKPLAGRLLTGFACLVLLGCSDDAGSSSWAWGNQAASDAGSDSASEVGGEDAVADASATSDGQAVADVGTVPDAENKADSGGLDGPAADAASGLTSCVSVAHIGDSLTYYTQTSLAEAYLSVGATALIDAFGGRAIKQKIADDPMTGKEAALSIVESGFTGCWVVALGTNDTANIAAGAWYTRAEAIDEMMNAIDPDKTVPVMWVNTYTTRTSGYYANDNMILWNEALVEAQQRWPNMKIHDWASIADGGVAAYADGIHHTAAGYEVRNDAIAHALAGFYPAP